MIEARFYRPEVKSRVRCFLCPHNCLISEGKIGICGVRRNRNGKLYSMVWGELIASHVDPVEKKPLFHFHPGTPIFSIAAAGCNFRCRHCQNADISQMPREMGRIAGRMSTPEEIVSQAKSSGCLSIAYTYTEPTIFFEYAYDTSVLASENGLKNVFVTNGYIEKEPLEAIAPYLDAANIDLKAFTEDFYRRICGAKLKPVMESIELYRKLNIWIEITTLIIPGLNDSDEELRNIACFIKGIGPEIPWHVSRFHPDYLMTDRQITPMETMIKASMIGRDEGLLYIYLGNVPGGSGEDTHCPNCGETVISRMGYRLGNYDVTDGNCSHCGHGIHGIGL